MTPTNIITTTTKMSGTLAQVREATLRARKDFPGAKQVAEMDLALYRKVLGKVRAVLAVTPTPELWADVSALENIVKALEDFVAFMGKHMEEFGSAFSAKAAQKDDVALLAFLEEDYAKFVRARESMVAERAMVAELLRPQWVEAEMGPPHTVAGPVVEEEEKAVEPPKNRAEKRRLEREAKKLASKKK
jgi:hypothetical protein